MQNKLFHISFRNLIISLAVVAALVVIVSLYAEPVLRISVIPDELPFVVNRKMKPLTDYLEQKIGMKVEFRPMRSGDALVESLLFKELDLVWIDDVRLVRARSLSNDGVMPIVRRREEELASPITVSPSSDHAYSWAVRAGLDTGLRQKLTDAFLAMNKDGGKGMEMLGYQHDSRFVTARAEDGSIDGTGINTIRFNGAITERTVPDRPWFR